MPHRLVLLDSLRSLKAGRPLMTPGGDRPMACLMFLEGAPEVHIVFDRLKRERWIEPGPSQHGFETWRITDSGIDILTQGEQWYRDLTWFQVILGRLGLPYCPSANEAPEHPQGLDELSHRR